MDFIIGESYILATQMMLGKFIETFDAMLNYDMTTLTANDTNIEVVRKRKNMFLHICIYERKGKTELPNKSLSRKHPIR
jgi:hypothetical protein